MRCHSSRSSLPFGKLQARQRGATPPREESTSCPQEKGMLICQDIKATLQRLGGCISATAGPAPA